jgi:shikimate kinase
LSDYFYLRLVNYASRHIILIGFMGSGKTTLGKKLARALNRTFVDSDAAIEQVAGMKIREIFETYGEDHFRQLESDWIEQLSPDEPAVIATGGGMPCFNNNLQELKNKGIVLYLQRPAKELLQRLKNAKNKRPLLAAMKDEEMLAFIEDKLNEREVFYLQADVVLSREEQELQVLLDIINSLL